MDEYDTFSDFIDLTGLQLRSEGECFVNPGIYVDVQSLMNELNNLECIKYYLRLDVQRGGFARISRICTSDKCLTKLHILTLSGKICKMLGLNQRYKNYGNGLDYITIKDNETLRYNERPINLDEC